MATRVCKHCRTVLEENVNPGASIMAYRGKIYSECSDCSEDSERKTGDS